MGNFEQPESLQPEGAGAPSSREDHILETWLRHIQRIFRRYGEPQGQMTYREGDQELLEVTVTRVVAAIAPDSMPQAIREKIMPKDDEQIGAAQYALSLWTDGVLVLARFNSRYPGEMDGRPGHYFGMVTYPLTTATERRDHHIFVADNNPEPQEIGETTYVPYENYHPELGDVYAAIGQAWPIADPHAQGQ